MKLILLIAAMAAAAAVSRDVTTSRTPTQSLAGDAVALVANGSSRTSADGTRRSRVPLHADGVRDGVASRLIASQDIRFIAVDVMIDTNDQPLAVYQLEFTASKGDVKIVGIEGSSHEAFREPPHFDPLAIQRERVILGAFNTAAAEKLPRGKLRIATIHLQITGNIEPAFDVKHTVIATVDGEAIAGAKVTAITRSVPL